MKYIKRYEIFENISSVTEKELFNLCDYALASILDNGFDYIIDDDFIVICLEDENGDLGQIKFDYADIKEEFITFLQHLNDKVIIKHISVNSDTSRENITYEEMVNDLVKINKAYTIMVYVEEKV